MKSKSLDLGFQMYAPVWMHTHTGFSFRATFVTSESTVFAIFIRMSPSVLMLVSLVISCCILFHSVKMFQFDFKSILDLSLQKLPSPLSTQHTIVKRLVGGNDASPMEAPFVVQLVRKNKTICTGTIIASDIILTAAHCV